MPNSRSDGFKASSNVISLPPLSFGETFEDAYEVILILDDREQFATRGSVTYFFCHISFHVEASERYFLFFLNIKSVLWLSNNYFRMKDRAILYQTNLKIYE